MIDRETVNSKGDRANLEGQKLPPAGEPLVSISWPDLRATV